MAKNKILVILSKISYSKVFSVWNMARTIHAPLISWVHQVQVLQYGYYIEWDTTVHIGWPSPFAVAGKWARERAANSFD